MYTANAMQAPPLTPDPRLKAPGTIPPVANAGVAGASNASGGTNGVNYNLGATDSTAGKGFYSYAVDTPPEQNNGYTQDLTGIPSYSEPSVTGEIPPPTGFVTTPASTNYLPTQPSTTLADSSLTASVQEGSNEAAIFRAPDLTGQLGQANLTASLAPAAVPIQAGQVPPVSQYSPTGTAQYLNYLA